LSRFVAGDKKVHYTWIGLGSSTKEIARVLSLLKKKSTFCANESRNEVVKQKCNRSL